MEVTVQVSNINYYFLTQCHYRVQNICQILSSRHQNRLSRSTRPQSSILFKPYPLSAQFNLSLSINDWGWNDCGQSTAFVFIYPGFSGIRLFNSLTLPAAKLIMATVQVLVAFIEFPSASFYLLRIFCTPLRHSTLEEAITIPALESLGRPLEQYSMLR